MSKVSELEQMILRGENDLRWYIDRASNDKVKLEERVNSLERQLEYNREGDKRCWKAIQTILSYLCIKLDEDVFGIKESKNEQERS